MAESPRPRDRLRKRLRAALIALALSVAWLAAAPAAAKLRSIETVRFCVTESLAPGATCDWQTVGLPHRWKPDASRDQWARYRIELGENLGTAAGVVASGLSPQGWLQSPDAWADAPDPMNTRRYLRYEPQLFLLAPDMATAGFVDLISPGHAAAVNGLRRVSVGPLAAAIAERDHLWRTEVLWPLLVAGCTLVAGVFALLGSGGSQRLALQLRLLGALSVLVAFRMSLNHVTDLPMTLGHWVRLKLALLWMIDVCYCLPVVAYLLPDQPQAVTRCAVAGAVVAACTALVPEAHLLRAATPAFSMLGLAGCGLMAWMIVRLVRVPDKLGALIALCFAGALLAGLLDLLRHLSWIGTDLASFQRTAAPLILTLILILLVRESTAYRGLEHQLAVESGRRENLLRDLHDVVGSRLVALAFRAGRPGVDSVIRTGIDELLRELQLIQQVVRGGSARLDELLADVRNIYGDWADLRPRIAWEVDDSMTGLALRPEQAVATVRIVQEAITNAMRHARPETITIRARRAQPDGAPEVRIEDDGSGAFAVGEHGGLRNMLARAHAAGLEVSFDSGAGRKAVRVTYPDTA